MDAPHAHAPRSGPLLYPLYTGGARHGARDIGRFALDMVAMPCPGTKRARATVGKPQAGPLWTAHTPAPLARDLCCIRSIPAGRGTELQISGVLAGKRSRGLQWAKPGPVFTLCSLSVQHSGNWWSDQDRRLREEEREVRRWLLFTFTDRRARETTASQRREKEFQL